MNLRFKLIKYSGTNIQVTNNTNNIFLFKKAWEEFCLSTRRGNVDTVDINENCKSQKLGNLILTEFVCCC